MNKTLVFFVALILLFGGMSVFVVAYQMSRNDGEDTGLTTKTIGVEQEYMKFPEGVPPDELITDFVLTDTDGELFESKSLMGDVHVASFFFSSCPGTCRAQNEAMRVLHSDYGSKGVKFLSITVDPENDSPATLSEYSQLFGADPDEWLFLTGDLLYTRRIGAEIYQMHVDKGEHTNRLAVVDRQGKLRGAFEWQEETQVGKMRQLIEQLLEEPAVSPADDSEANGAESELADQSAEGGDSEDADSVDSEGGESDEPLSSDDS